jgi:fatty-acyl-CoA synthase
MLFLFPKELEEMAGESGRQKAVESIAFEDFIARDVVPCELPQAKGEEIAYLQYSSGSTRFPHGVAVTHHALLSNLAAHSHGMEVQDSDRCISWLPWYHDMGLVGCFLSVVANQVSTDYMKTEDFARRPLAWLDLISRNEGTSISYSPTFGYDICARRMSSQTKAADRFDLSRWRLAAGRDAELCRRVRRCGLFTQGVPAELWPGRSDAGRHHHAAGRGYHRRVGRRNRPVGRRRDRGPSTALPLDR